MVMDAHELFPEVPEIQNKPLVRWVWRTVERLMMPRCDARLTVCQSIADYYRRKLGVDMTVVRNIASGEGNDNFEIRNSKYEIQNSLAAALGQLSAFRVLLYQGAVNMGRGVDWAIDALEFLPDCCLVVAGGGDLLAEMKRYAAEKAWADRVLFLGRLAPYGLERFRLQKT